MGETCRGDQEDNILSVQGLFSPVLKQMRIPGSIHLTDVNRMRDMENWLPAWKVSLDDGRGSALDALDLQDAAVIGFEMSGTDCAHLDARGVPWVNFAIHPLRFLDDLYLDVATSFPYDLSRHAASPGVIDFCAQALRQRYRRAPQAEPARTLAIFGQTPIDRSVYFDGEFRTLDHYLARLDEVASGHARVFYKPHPYLSDPKVDELLIERYGAERYTDTDVYRFFIEKNIATACALSSSVLFEAPHFGVEAVFLEPRARRYGSPIDYRGLLDDQAFWERFLQQPAGQDDTGISRVVPRNYLRTVFSSWGYLTDDRRLEQDFQRRLDGVRQELRHSHEAALQSGIAPLQAELSEMRQALAAAQAEMQAETQAARADAQASRAAEQAAQARYDEILHSTSWRVMAPMRRAADLARGRLTPAHKQKIKRLLERSAQFVNRRPALKRQVMRVLNRFPRVRSRLANIVTRSFVADPGRHMAGVDAANLTPRARQALVDLKAAVERQAKGGVR